MKKISFFVNEIFASINGEGTLSGELAIFLRLSGCNLKCSYCDTKYAQEPKSGYEMTIDEIVEKISEYKGYKNITITGGEPLFRKNIQELLATLAELGYILNIETNGSIDLIPYLDKEYSKNIIFCCDYKLPSSFEEHKMCLSNISKLRANDVLKFVIGSKEDLIKVLSIIQQYKPSSYIYLSAVFGKITPREIVEEALTWAPIADTSKLRVQLQLHKFIWGPEMRGV